MNTVQREVRTDVTGMKQLPLPPLGSEQLYSDFQNMPASGNFHGIRPNTANHPLSTLTEPDETRRTGACQGAQKTLEC